MISYEKVSFLVHQGSFASRHYPIITISYTTNKHYTMNFNDVMVIITGILCFLVGILMVPMIDAYALSHFGFNLPVALVGVIDLILILGIIYFHTSIVLYNQKRKIKSISEGFANIFKGEEPVREEK